MESPIKNLKISESGRDQLIRLKRHTGIETWNILCRWALCRSLTEPHPPSPVSVREANSTIDIDWPTFAGPYGDLFIALLRQRCHDYGLRLDDVTLNEQFRLHVHRGIATLAAAGEEVKTIEDLLALSLKE